MSATHSTCPACNSTDTVNNGFIDNGKQNFKCRTCGRPEAERLRLRSLCKLRIRKSIDSATKDLIDKLLLEKIPLAQIATVVGV